MESRRNSEHPVQMPELLAPAGNLEKLKTAIHYGADAVYLGGEKLSLRANAGNFSVDDLGEGVSFAHDQGAKVYVAVNIFAHNRDFVEVGSYLELLADNDVDGIIVADPGILNLAKTCIPHIPIHLSTQANVTNLQAANFWFSQGVSRCNLARELSFSEIEEIRAGVNKELEIFVHGAICISYSGRCMLSNYLTDRDANQGNCSQPCRFNYAVCEEKRPGQYYPVEEDGRGTYIFNSKDLCLLARLPQLVAMGVDSLKIEGRMKSIFYVGGVVRLYRAALDYLQQLPARKWENPAAIDIPEELIVEIEKTGTRGITENFAGSPPTARDMLFTSSRARQSLEPVAVIRQIDPFLLEVRNRIETGERVEYMGQGAEVMETVVQAIYREDGTLLERAHPGQRVIMETDPPVRGCRQLDMFRRYVQ